MKKLIFLTALFLMFLVSGSISQPVIHQSAESTGLAERWEAALNTARGKEFRDGFWIGFSLDRLMGENSFVGSFNEENQRWASLTELIYNKKEKSVDVKKSDNEEVKDAAKKMLDRLEKKNSPETKVIKEMGFLYQFGKRDVRSMKKVKISNLSLVVDLEKKPLLWLGKATESESIELVKQLYSTAVSDEIKEDLLMCAGLHETSSIAADFLTDIIEKGKNGKIREKAVFWLGNFETDRTLKLLKKIATQDRSIEVREKAVFSLYRMKSESADGVLIELAYCAKNKEVREKAIFWLGQKASKKSAQVLKNIAVDEDDLEIQKKAIFALSQLSDNEGVPHLIKLAKTHPSIEVRKSAIFWLGQSTDPRAIETLVELIRKQ